MPRPRGYLNYRKRLNRSERNIRKLFVDVSKSLVSVAAELPTQKLIKGETALKLTIQADKKFRDELAKSANSLRRGLTRLIKKDTELAVQDVKNPIDKQMVTSLSAYLDRKVLNDLALNTTKYVNEIQFKKKWLFADGKVGRFSNGAWSAIRVYRKSVDEIVREGLRVGRDMVEVAKDLEIYLKGGRQSLARRYANVDVDASFSAFKRRIPISPDYRALRLARTTMQGAVQDATVAGFETNPSVQQFNWVLSPLHKKYSVCEDIVASNPHTYEKFSWGLPPHPNCLSHAEAIQVSRAKFNSDLKAWVENPRASGSGYINQWYGKYYLPTENGQKVLLTRLLKNNIIESERLNAPKNQKPRK